MVEINPPGFLQNAGSVHTAEILREGFNGLVAGAWINNAQRARGGVHPSLGFQLKVQAAGSPNMTVDILNGHVYIPGSENALQGSYSCFNSSTVNRAIAASDPSLPRIDLVVAKVQDTFYSGGANTWSIVVSTGTP